MKQSQWERLETLSGVAFAVLVVVAFAFLFNGSPDFMGTPAEYTDYALDHEDDLIIGGLIGGLSVFALLWFVGTVRAHLARAEAAEGRVAGVAYAGGLFAAVSLYAAFAVKLAVGFRVDEQGAIAGESTAALLDVGDVVYGVGAPLGFAVLVAATAVLAFRASALPHWLGWVSAVMAIGMVAPLAPWLVVMLMPVWTAAVSVLLYRASTARQLRSTPAAAAPAATL